MHIPLAFCGIASFSNSVWLFGGLKEDNDEIVSGKDVFQFDALTETWNKVAELSVPRHAAVTVSLGLNIYLSFFKISTCALYSKFEIEETEIDTKWVANKFAV